MTATARNDVRRRVLRYVNNRSEPVRISDLAADLRKDNAKLSELRDSDFRAVVQPMIVTGKLSYAPGLRIRSGKKAT
jgi:hypothetical protein